MCWELKELMTSYNLKAISFILHGMVEVERRSKNLTLGELDNCHRLGPWWISSLEKLTWSAICYDSSPAFTPWTAKIVKVVR